MPAAVSLVLFSREVPANTSGLPGATPMPLQLAASLHKLSVALPLPVWNIDRDQIDHIIQGSAETPFIYAVVVEAASHRHIHVRDAQWRFIHSDKPFPPIDGMVVQQRPIVFSGQHVGTVSVYATPKFIAAELRRSAMSFAITVVLIDVLLVLCVYFVLHRMVLRPVVEIERYALAVSSGGGELAKPLPSGSAAELVSLQSSIESMVALLDRRYVELQEEMVLRFESEERFRTIFDSVNDIIIIYDPESGAILDVNAKADRTDESRGERINRRFRIANFELRNLMVLKIRNSQFRNSQ